MSLRKIALLVVIVLFAASVETAWNVRGNLSIGPEGCRVMGGRFYGPSWSFEAAAERPVTGSSPQLEVENAFGSVRVSRGAPGIVKVKLRKVVFRSTEESAREFAGRIELRLSGDGDRVKVETNRDTLGRHEDTGFETHLEIEAPPESVAQVRSEHGRVELLDLAAADVTASHDGVTLERIKGDVTLDVRHGNVSAERVGGKLKLSARHGDVALAGVAGAATIDMQHGNLSARETGSLELEISYGDVSAASVGGDLNVRGQHAPVTASDVSGRAEVATSFGDVRLERVLGDGRVKVEHGKVAASDVSGGFWAETSYEGVELDRVRGPVELKVQHGGVEARGLEGGARVHASGDNVTLEGFTGAVDVEVERGSARLAPGAPIQADVLARASHGEVALEVPDGSAFRLEAESQHGQVDAPLAGLRSEREERRRGQRVLGQQGSGGPQVKLLADGDVRLESRPPRAVSDGGVQKPRVAATTTPEASVERPRATPAPKPSPAPTAEHDARPTPEAKPNDPGAR